MVISLKTDSNSRVSSTSHFQFLIVSGKISQYICLNLNLGQLHTLWLVAESHDKCLSIYKSPSVVPVTYGYKQVVVLQVSVPTWVFLTAAHGVLVHIPLPPIFPALIRACCCFVSLFCFARPFHWPWLVRPEAHVSDCPSSCAISSH